MNRMVRTSARIRATISSAATVPAVLAAPDPAGDPTADLKVVIDNAVGWIAGIAFAIATLFATAGFALYMMAGGDTTQIERAKTAWKAAAVGYAGVILAPVLLGILSGILGN
ncbi:pilin [Phytohabitans houttuyneae]|uniref:TrbC/VIRB2 family protein n=1 Tax=Phytohabitans houttuyneae TaxID=1076126 RepID=A0A6V8K618_9ACTN|nr:pilin [Phytohabitans houttuyneae]GFJ77436.1 hypothetical protein Phou_016160 [Phytohabitans houttuyneae]